MATTPSWHVAGDWFDVCKCNVPCPCTFAQAPSYGDCDGVLAYHIRRGRYGEVPLDGLNLIGVSHFVGNIWNGETKAMMGLFIDQRASEPQRAALQLIWGGQAVGFPSCSQPLSGRCAGSSTFRSSSRSLTTWRIGGPRYPVTSSPAPKPSEGR
jgi:hypothetical protein